MSLPHILMLGLIDGASVGTVVDPPATVGELANLTVEQFYAVDMRPNRYEPQPLTNRQWKFLRQVIATRKRDRIRAMRDDRYHAALERRMRKALEVA